MTNGTNEPKKLYKSRRNRMIDGVCGGIAEYFGVDVTIIRILFVLLGLMGGTGLLVYVTGMIIMPTNPNFGTPGEIPPVQGNGKRFWGIALILVGTTILFVNLGWVSGLPWWSFSGTVIFPVLMIAAGLLVIINGLKKAQDGTGKSPGSAESDTETGENMKREPVRELRRSIRNRKLFGVCGGLGDYFSIDATIVRLAFVVLVFASFGWALLVYIALGILMPEENLSIQS
jgi:phage shock protein C